MRSLFASLGLSAIVCSFSPTLHAQAAAADALFESARAAMSKGDFASACEQFRASDKLDPAVGTELNLADCEEKRGRVASAWELYRAVGEKLSESDERVTLARERIRSLEPRVPKVTLTLAANAPQNCAVRDGNVELGSAAFGVALPFDPGPHDLVVSAPGYEARTYHVLLAEGQAQALTVEPGPSGAPAAPAIATPGPIVPASSSSPPPSLAPSHSSKRTVGFVIGGVGVAGLGVGAISGALMLSKKHALDGDCNPDKSCNAAGVDAAHSAHTFQVVSNVGWIAGALALGTGAFLVLTSGSDERPSTSLALGPNLAGAQFSVARSF